MTDTQTPPVGFGRALGETARSAQVLHHKVLAGAGTDFESWVVFTLLTENAPAMPKEALVVDLTRRLGTDRSAIGAVLDRMAAAGHVATRTEDGAELIALTEAGATFLAGVRQAVDQLTEKLTGDIDPQDMATTIRVLRAVGGRAAPLLQP